MEARCLRDSSRWEEKGSCCEIYPVLYSKVEARDNGKGLLSLLPPPVFWFQPGGRTGATSRGNLCKHHTQGLPSTERHSLPKPRPPQHDPVQRSYRRGGAASSEEERPGSPRSGRTEQGQEKRRPWHPRRGGPTRRPAPVMPAEPLTAEAASSGRGTGAPLNQDTRHPER